MREIEIKVAVADHQATKHLLKQKGIILSPARKQRDIVYCLPGSKDGAIGVNWLRIRTENDKIHTFTFKQSVTDQLDSIEHETKVGDPDQLTQIIKLMGYELYSDLTKVRQKAQYGDVEICFDHIEGLGYFIEAERLCPNDVDHQLVIAELWDLLTNLGFCKADSINVGYDVLMRQKMGINK